MLIAREAQKYRRRRGDATFALDARQRGGKLKRKEPWLAARLERDRVLDVLGAIGCLHDATELRIGRAPDASVKTRQDRSAPIALPRRRRRALEVHAKRHSVGQRELGEHARRHRVGQTGPRAAIGR